MKWVNNCRYGGEVDGGGIVGEVNCGCCEGVIDGNGCSGGETDVGQCWLIVLVVEVRLMFVTMRLTEAVDAEVI